MVALTVVGTAVYHEFSTCHLLRVAIKRLTQRLSGRATWFLSEPESSSTNGIPVEVDAHDFICTSRRPNNRRQHSGRVAL